MLHTFWRVVCHFCRLHSSWDVSPNSQIFLGLYHTSVLYAPSAPLWIRPWNVSMFTRNNSSTWIPSSTLANCLSFGYIMLDIFQNIVWQFTFKKYIFVWQKTFLGTVWFVKNYIWRMSKNVIHGKEDRDIIRLNLTSFFFLQELIKFLEIQLHLC